MSPGEYINYFDRLRGKPESEQQEILRQAQKAAFPTFKMKCFWMAIYYVVVPIVTALLVGVMPVRYFDFPMIVNGLLLSGGILLAIFAVRRLHGRQLRRGLSLVINHEH